MDNWEEMLNEMLVEGEKCMRECTAFADTVTRTLGRFRDLEDNSAMQGRLEYALRDFAAVLRASIRNSAESFMNVKGISNYMYGELVIAYGENQCGNCTERMEPGDLYCRICGTRRGEGEFKPYRNVMQCVYGPMPELRKHKCGACGYEWETMKMIDREKFCPMCGRSISSLGFKSPLRN